MTAAEELERLRAEVAFLRDLVAKVRGDELVARVQQRLGCAPQPARFLCSLLSAHDATISNGRLYDLVFADVATGGGPDFQIIRAVVFKLRQKLAAAGVPGRIDTIWGNGFRADAQLVAWFKAEFTDEPAPMLKAG